MKSYLLDNPERREGAEARLLWPVEATSVSLRYQHELFRERVRLRLLGLLIGISSFNGAMLQSTLEFRLGEGLHAGVEYTHYQSSEHFGYFYGMGKNDRLDLLCSWAFGLL
jgi:hypothetical protein